MWDLKRLRLLRELQVRGTVTAVAQTLNFSVSTVSQQLALLEKEVGLPLLEKDGRRVRLTQQGLAVARHAARVMDAEETVRSELLALTPGQETVRVAMIETAARALLPYALSSLAETHPQIRVEVAVVPPEIGLFELEARHFDLAIAEQYPGYTRPQRPGLDRVRLGTDPMRLSVPPESTVASLAEAADWEWVMEPPGAAVHAWATEQCRSAGFEPDVRYQATDLLVHVRLVAAGHAVSVLPDLVWAGDTSPRPRLVELPGSPRRELFSAARAASRERATVRAVHDALAAAFTPATRELGIHGPQASELSS